MSEFIFMNTKVMENKVQYIIKNFHGEKQKKTSNENYKYLFTGKADVIPKGKLLK